jgi:ankyrin repeat protein
VKVKIMQDAYNKNRQELTHIISKDDPAALEKFLKAQPEMLEFPNAEGQSALRESLWYSKAKVAATLISLGADVNCRSTKNDRETCLHIAARKENAEWSPIVESLLRKGADVNAIGEGHATPLHNAATLGSNEIVRLLLANNADPNIQDGDGATPLHWCSARGRADSVSVLLKSGANPKIVDDAGWTPLIALRKSVEFGDDLTSRAKTFFLNEGLTHKPDFDEVFRLLEAASE